MFVSFQFFYSISILFSDYLCRRTVKDNTDFSCRFDIDTDPRCPIFRIGYILQKMQEEDSTINLTALYSQVIIQFEMEFQRENYN